MLWAVEVKCTTRPKVTRRSHIAVGELGVTERLLVYAGGRGVPEQEGDAFGFGNHADERSIGSPELGILQGEDISG